MLMPSIFGNNFMNDFFGGFPYKSNGTMQTDVSETDKGYKVTMNLPGYQKEDIKGEVKDGYLTVTATTVRITMRRIRMASTSARNVTAEAAAEAFMSAMQ